MLERSHEHHGHIHRFSVRHDMTGWEIREEDDSVVVRRAHYDDWHRVERALLRFELNAHAGGRRRDRA